MTQDEFIKEISNLGINITKKQLNQLDIIYNRLIETNKTMNLTRITSFEDVYLKHYYDSLTLSRLCDLSKEKTLCDIGTGAGFPGLILKVIYPNLKVTLVDSLLKRVNYLNNLIDELNLNDVKAYHIRAEDLIKENKKFDIVTARAVKALPKLLLWTMPLVKKDGCFLAMKSNVDEELIEAKNIMQKNNWYISKKEIFYLPKSNDLRTILKIENKN